jgi:predicted protein tyrosine phosphatase
VTAAPAHPGSAPLKLLFVCSQNKLRSPTAEALYRGHPGYRVKSAGTKAGSGVRITGGLIGWADRIFVMEKNHALILREKYPDALVGKHLVCLHIPDEYQYMDPELIAVLKAKLSRFLPPS